MKIRDEDFSSDEYSAILGDLKNQGYLSQTDPDKLLVDCLENMAIYLINISSEKAEIVRKTLFENSNCPTSE